jgi:hypothetical protein
MIEEVLGGLGSHFLSVNRNDTGSFSKILGDAMRDIIADALGDDIFERFKTSYFTKN